MATEPNLQFQTQRYNAAGEPVYEPGDQVAGSVTIVPDQDANVRGVQMWIGCRIHGSGTSEAVDLLPEQFIHQGPLQAGMPINASFSVQLPENAPLSYHGRRIRFDWEVRLRIDVPIWPDQRSGFGFAVVPRSR